MYHRLLIPVAAISMLLSAGCGRTPSPTVQTPVPVIFDTDVGNDIDDVLAMQMLFNYEDSGKIDLLGITISKSNPYAIQYIDGYCRLHGRPDIPLGFAYNGANPEDGGYNRQVLDTVIDGRHILEPVRSIADSLPEGFRLLRRLLASVPDSSVVLIATGPETNIARLLESGPDEFSPLDGRSLAARKVKLLSVMGGLYGDEFDFPEWNIVQDLPAAQTVFSEWPGEMIASGWELGNRLLYPNQSILNDFANGDSDPLCVAYKVYAEMPYDRQTWDLTSVLQAIEPDSAWFTLSEPGKIAIDSIGRSIYAPEACGRQRYMSIPEASVGRTLRALVSRVTGKAEPTMGELESPGE